jgi:hypothetical protein
VAFDDAAGDLRGLLVFQDGEFQGLFPFLPRFIPIVAAVAAQWMF